jgi:hypothetical protein
MFDLHFFTISFLFSYNNRGSVHKNQVDLPFLLPLYLRRLTGSHSVIDPVLAMELNNRITLLYLSKHLGIISKHTFLLLWQKCLDLNVLTLRQAIRWMRIIQNWWKSTPNGTTKEFPSQIIRDIRAAAVTTQGSAHLRSEAFFFSRSLRLDENCFVSVSSFLTIMEWLTQLIFVFLFLRSCSFFRRFFLPNHIFLSPVFLWRKAASVIP